MSVRNISIPHSLMKEEAIYRMKRLLDDLSIRFSDEIKDVREDWQANVNRFELTARGIHFTGTMEVEDWKTLVAIQYPPEAQSFIDHIEMHIRTMSDTLLR